ncbi:hypothetical protein NPIL_245721 [Nephila pilipes]|uniref:Uncharacterized protein n=1 Tax=Nephila pilipes TaxID=299642 RepID=A0A8X6TZZ9_NEPPI|nr:hypothetical protein NPIL_245721 [Nephila pilipes]
MCKSSRTERYTNAGSLICISCVVPDCNQQPLVSREPHASEPTAVQERFLQWGIGRHPWRPSRPVAAFPNVWLRQTICPSSGARHRSCSDCPHHYPLLCLFRMSLQ